LAAAPSEKAVLDALPIFAVLVKESYKFKVFIHGPLRFDNLWLEVVVVVLLELFVILF
jgi:hypothetical protein